MKLAVIGVNHKTAPVALRERLSFGSDLTQAITDICHLDESVLGVVIVSTCNRSEIYVGFDDEWQATHDDDVSVQARLVRSWFAKFKGMALDDMLPFLYIYENNRALNHWLRVASGLDSMILGEPQILGQIRKAVSQSQAVNGMGSDFHWLTQQIFASARSVRRDSKVGQQAVTLGFAAAKLVTQIFDKPEDATLLMVAAGEMNRLVAHNVANLGMKNIIIANRSPKRAELLKDELVQMADNAGRMVHVRCVGLDSLETVLSCADVVSSCSGSMDTLIDAHMVRHAQKVRRHRPLLLVDLAVPRDIDPMVGGFDDVYLYSVDDLQHVIAGNLQERKQAAVEAELMVSQLTLSIESQMQLLSAKRYIADYRMMADNHKRRLLSHAKHRLAQGDDMTAVLDEFAHRLTNTLTHSPSRLIRTIATHQDSQLLEMVATGLMDYRDGQV
ncbi:glutamyl-tRNA reductase [Moraxella nonliquefaciens]|uniref:glutamyl-tRNA reductase n=1 Tax=Moraxella nonliquefaciens TaxID=478 RepID=UPI001EF48C17|nr:glutamyl-tRNA reductase [Moraxella nonliquefaciens]MCG7411142.1 glutamyl-tRNA reductase [Moraxella nonliquefaciens]